MSPVVYAGVSLEDKQKIISYFREESVPRGAGETMFTVTDIEDKHIMPNRNTCVIGIGGLGEC